jgi:hypothetical protein
MNSGFLVVSLRNTDGTVIQGQDHSGILSISLALKIYIKDLRSLSFIDSIGLSVGHLKPKDK